MYVILTSMALAIYTLILVDFSQFHQELSLHGDLITSAQAFYAAESGVELSLSTLGDQEIDAANKAFYALSNDRSFLEDEGGLTYQEGVKASLISKKLSLNQGQLWPAQESSKGVFQSNEPLASRGFSIREIPPESNFNELHFSFNQADETSEVALDIFEFPKSGSPIDFANFQMLKDSPEGYDIKRLTINTQDSYSSNISLSQTLSLSVQMSSGGGNFKRNVVINGFEPLENNYLLYFQSLDNAPIHFELAAFHQAEPVVLPGMFQTVDILASTPTGLFQRVSFQRESEELLVPGLNFVHFSDQAIHK